MKRRAVRGLARVLLVVTTLGCGYRPLHAARPEGERLAVVVVASHVTPAITSDEVATGVREALSESGAVRSGEGYPRAEIEVLRLDEESEAIGEVTTPGSPSVPVARGLRVGVVARAWVRRSAADAKSNDTGDLRAFVVTGATREAGAGAALAFEQAARAAGRRVGQRLGARILGHPAASE